MAGYTIRATIDDLNNSANIIDQNAQTVKSEVDSVSALLHELRGTFLGNRADNFFKVFFNDEQAMKNWYNTVEAFASELRAAAASLGAADNA